MPLPTGVPKVTVTTAKPLITPGGTPYQGHLEFVGPDLVTVGGLDLVIGGQEPAYLTAGVFSIDLVPNDLNGMNPSGWTYTVEGVFSNAPNFTRYVRLPSGTSPVQLADILVPDPVTGAFTTLIDPSSLGGAALLDVGQVAGTVAAGDDPRFGGSTPSGTVAAQTTFGGSSTAGVATAYSRGDHAHGTPAAPTKATVGLGNVDNTSDAAKPISTAVQTALIAEVTRANGAYDPSGAASAALTAANSYTDSHSGGGGGGHRLIPHNELFDAGIITLTAQANPTPVVGTNGVHVRRICPGVTAGDIMVFSAAFLTIGTTQFLDGRVLKADGVTPSHYLSEQDIPAVPGPEGYAPWYAQLSLKGFPGDVTFVAAADEIDGSGNWTIEMVYWGSGITGTDSRLYFGNGYRGHWDVNQFTPA